MKAGNKNTIQHYFMMVLLVFAGISCTGQQDGNSVDLDNIPAFHPEQIVQFDHIDSLYYSYLGINSFASDDGSFILPVWDPAALVKTNADATEIIATTGRGKGPGEFLDIGQPTMGGESIYVFDQFQQKIVVLNRNDLSLAEEIIPDPYRDYQIYRAYPAFQDGTLPLELNMARLVVDKIRKKMLVSLNPENNEYGKSMRLEGRPYAPLGDVINSGTGSAMMVPFANDQFIVSVPERRTLLLYDTRTDTIAEINAGFDTLRTIPVNLPTEKLSEAEKDTIRVNEDLSNDDWQSVESRLPEIKAPADDMLYHRDEIWLKSNLRGKNDIWLVLNMEGEIMRSVYLPQNSMLTHVSDRHLGVRLDEIMFGLYENTGSESEN